MTKSPMPPFFPVHTLFASSFKSTFPFTSPSSLSLIETLILLPSSSSVLIFPIMEPMIPTWILPPFSAKNASPPDFVTLTKSKSIFPPS